MTILDKIFQSSRKEPREPKYNGRDLALLKELDSLTAQYKIATENLLRNMHEREHYENVRLAIKDKIVEIELLLEKRGINRNRDY